MAATTGGDAATAESAQPTATTVEERVLAATLVCVARHGVAATTLDDVASEAHCSRATIYRAFPGGWDVLLAAAAAQEVTAQVADLAERLTGVADLEDLLVEAVTSLSWQLRHHEILRRLCEHEPTSIRPHLSFDGLDPLLARAVEVGAPWLEPYTDRATARATAEWIVRLVLSYGEAPIGACDLTDPVAARRLVRTFVLPALVPDTA